ncbi:MULTISPECIES: hypothetical protein [Burkholderia]|uniref:hypothetical protein n=1 Tax=Burkholderia TaxID=32008 RepID=UPI00163FFFC5|nr:hypothetical protein [Burkholderia gladioli]
MNRKAQTGQATEKLLTTIDAAALLVAMPVTPPAGHKPTLTPAQRFVLPDVMRNWPILDDRDREPRRPGYGAEG